MVEVYTIYMGFLNYIDSISFKVGDLELRSTMYSSLLGCICALAVGSVFMYLAYSLKKPNTESETPKDTQDRKDTQQGYVLIGTTLWLLSILILLVGIGYYYLFFKGGTRKQRKIKQSMGQWTLLDTFLNLFGL